MRDERIIAADDDEDLGIWPEDLPAVELALQEIEDCASSSASTIVGSLVS